MSKPAAAVLFVGLLSFFSARQNTSPDLILFNGKVFTSNPAQPSAEALAIRGDRIVAVGASEKIKSLAGG